MIKLKRSKLGFPVPQINGTTIGNEIDDSVSGKCFTLGKKHYLVTNNEAMCRMNAPKNR